VNLLYGVITSSIVGSIVFLVLLLLRPITGTLFSKTWHYCCLFVPLVFLLGGTHIAVSLTGLVSYQRAIEMTPSLVSQDVQMGFSNNITISPILDNISPMYNHVMDVNLTTIPPITHFTSIANQLISHLERVTPFIFALWVLGAVVFMTINAIKYFKYRRIVLQGALPFFADWGHGSVCDGKIPIAVSATAHTPMLIGLIKPTIILPYMYFTKDELNMILAHEMVHYRRKDLLIKLFMLVANAVHWFNPVVYALNRQLNAMCELSCDEKVVSEMDTQDRRFYGETILQVLKHSMSQKRLVGNIAFATNLCNPKKNFKRRLTSMMNTKKTRKSVTILALVTGLIIAGGGFVISNMIGSFMPVYASEAQVEPEDYNPVQHEIQTASEENSFTPSEIQTESESEENSTVQNQFLWPLVGYTRISSGFGTRRNPISGEVEFHTGLDIPAPAGTPIFAAQDGYVTFSEWTGESGYTIILYHGNGYSTLYSHASTYHVEKGDFVRQGELIARVGTQDATGPHLHFEIRYNNQPIDPLDQIFVDSVLDEMLAERIRNTNAPAPAPAPIEVIRERLYTIQHPVRNITFEMTHIQFDFSPVYPNFSPEVANAIADAIYEKFGICINGMRGSLFLGERMYDTSWIGNIFSEELPTHSPNCELFHFIIDAITGEVLALYMNTEETPFH